MAAAQEGFRPFSSQAASAVAGRGWGLARGARTPRTKGPHVPARRRAPAPAPAQRASPRRPSPPEDHSCPSHPPHTLAHALWLPHAHVLNPRRPSCRLQFLPGLSESLRVQIAFIERKNNVSHRHSQHYISNHPPAPLGLIEYMFVFKPCRTHSFYPPGLYFQC